MLQIVGKIGKRTYQETYQGCLPDKKPCLQINNLALLWRHASVKGPFQLCSVLTNYDQSTTVEERLNSLALIHVHCEIKGKYQ